MKSIFISLVVLFVGLVSTAAAQDGAASCGGCDYNFAAYPCPGAVCAAEPNLRDAKAIDAILYGSDSREDRLAKLKPYAEPMQSLDEVKGRLALDGCVTSGPGVVDCGVVGSGLRLVFDPDKKLRLIRRSARVVDGVAQQEQSITDRGFEWQGYRRWYEN